MISPLARLGEYAGSASAETFDGTGDEPEARHAQHQQREQSENDATHEGLQMVSDLSINSIYS